MNEIIKEEDISSKIYTIRGVEVMLDSDLAKIYQCKNGTKEINQAVKNNIDKFPERYVFRITDKEYGSLKSKILTSKGGSRKGHTVFTEQGVYMLATILKSKIATEVTLKIMDIFVKMRHFYIENKDIYQSLNSINIKLDEHDEKINKLFSIFDKPEILHLNGEEYDAYSDFVTIAKMANKELIIIDEYADNIILDIIRKLSCNVILVTKDSDRLSSNEIDKYNKEYNNLKVIRNNTFHDRYLIIDRKDIYHSGTSINNAGNKVFSIHKMNDDFVTNKLLDYIENIINNYEDICD